VANRSAEYSYVTDDDEPTKPDGIADPAALLLVRLHSELDPVARKRLTRLVESWAACSNEQRVLIEELAFELSLRG
jgi:hypothetical protein